MEKSPNRRFLTGLARAVAGAILFSLPLLMTEEMWNLGFHMKPLRLALLIVVLLPVLAGLAYYSGFEKQLTFTGIVVDAFVAYAVGFASATCVLSLLAVINGETSMTEILGKITLQAVPGGFGAVVATSQLGGEHTELSDEAPERPSHYFAELFLMLCGALFFAFNIAPTEEIVVIAYRITAWHAIALMLASIAVMHGFVYAVEFHGQKDKPAEHSWWSIFVRFTIVGYALSMCASYYCLWSFGRVDGTDPAIALMASIVLAFPTAIGAAAARLIL